MPDRMDIKSFLDRLEPESLYCPELVVSLAEETGLIYAYVDVENPVEKIRDDALEAVSRFARHKMPHDPDGEIEGKAGWWGCRWQSNGYSCHEKQAEARNTLMGLEAGIFLGSCAQVTEPTSITMRGKRRTFGLGRHRRSLTLVALATCFFAFASFSGLDREGFRILLAEGPAAAYAWFSQRSAEGLEEPGIRFGMAWSLFSKGDFARAEEMGLNLLGEPGIQEATRANIHYMLGHIQTRQGRYALARESFSLSMSIDEELGKDQNLFLTLLGLTDIAIATGEFVQAEGYLEDARVLSEMVPGVSMGDYFNRKKELAFERGHYEEALQYANQCHGAFKADGKQSMLADSLSDMGLLYTLIGDPERGFEKTIEAQELIQLTGNRDKYYYNLANFIALRRYEHRSFEAMAHRIRLYARESNDPRLERLLNFVVYFPFEAAGKQGGSVTNMEQEEYKAATSPNDVRYGESEPSPPNWEETPKDP